MKVWTNNRFSGLWPVGTAAVVVSDYATDAADLLNRSLKERGLLGDAKDEDMKEVPTYKEGVFILRDGDY